MFAVLIGILSLGIIVLIHELGHYLFAKYYKVHVEEFAIGIGPKFASIMWKDTLWSLRIFPFGGFCRMKNPQINTHYGKTDPMPKEEGTLSNLSYKGKFLVLLGGPFANVVLFIVISLFLFSSGGKNYELASYIEPIANPALASPLQTGDRIIKLNDTVIKSYSQLADTANTLAGQDVTLEFIRANTTNTINFTLNISPPSLGVIPYIPPIISLIPPKSLAENLGLKVGDTIVEVQGEPVNNAISLPNLFKNEQDSPITFYIIRNENRIRYDALMTKKVSILKTFGIKFETVEINEWNTFSEFLSVKFTQMYSIATTTALFFLDLLQFKTKKIVENTVGPIRLISIVGNNTIDTAGSYGIWFAIIQFLNITSLLSIAIASLNLLPIPVLDGGQLAFYTFYRIRKKHPSIQSMIRYNMVGGIILLLLFGFIMFSDIISFF